jgi:hypothetical protein
VVCVSALGSALNGTWNCVGTKSRSIPWIGSVGVWPSNRYKPGFVMFVR